MQLEFIMTPIECGADGNCLPLSLSYLLGGDYDHFEVNLNLFNCPYFVSMIILSLHDA
jgi:hypothetical protein